MPRIENISLRDTRKKKERAPQAKFEPKEYRLWNIETPDASPIPNRNSDKINSSAFDEDIQEGEKIYKIDPRKICLSPSKTDRENENERSEDYIQELAQSMEENSQIQPCVVKPTKIPGYEYELTIGECRWRAAKVKNLMLDVVIRETNKQTSFAQQIQENTQRKNLSDYALGMFCARGIENRLVTQKDLHSILKVSEVEVTRLLSFSKIPQEIIDAINDMRLVSSRTSSEIRALTKKGPEYIEAIIMLAPKIRAGKLGDTTLRREVMKIINKEGSNKTPDDFTTEIRTASGRHLFTWRKDSNGNPSISFPKDIREQITNEKDRIETFLRDKIEEILLEKKHLVKKQ